MKPKDKAKELIDKYVGFKLNPYNDPEMSQTLYKAKKNALICVNEILEELGEELKLAYNYWKEVKEEIKNI